jgi:hypothetical protein
VVYPCSDRISRVPPYSRTYELSTGTGLSPTMAKLSSFFPFLLTGHWPGPRSLATTNGVSFDVLSSGYLDVSVPRVSSLSGDLTVGFPHSEILGSKLIRSSPRLIAAYYVLHRLHTPRHPLNALKTLDRSHYQCPQYQQPDPLLYGSGLHHRADAFIRSITAPVLIGQIKKNQNSRTSTVSPRGCRVKRDSVVSLYDVERSGHGCLAAST